MAPNHADASGIRTEEIIDVDTFQIKPNSSSRRRVLKASSLKKGKGKGKKPISDEAIIIDISSSDTDEGIAKGPIVIDPIVIDIDSDIEEFTKVSQTPLRIPQKRPAPLECVASTSKRIATRPSSFIQRTSNKHKIENETSPLASLEPKLKKPRIDDITWHDKWHDDENEKISEDDFENYHAGFDIKNGESWLPLYVVPVNNEEEELQQQLKALTLKPNRQLKNSVADIRDVKRSKRIPSELRTFLLFRESRNDHRLWNILSTAKEEANKSVKQMRSEGILFNRLHLPSLKNVSYTKQTSGCPTKIVQRHKTVVVSCASIGGGPDPDELEEPNYQPDPYNREGNLIIWYEDDQFRPSAHQRLPDRRPMINMDIPGQRNRFREFQKFYTINDVVFDPLNSDTMVTSGMDCVVREWKLVRKPDDTLDFQEPLQIYFSNVPNDLSFRPNSSILGVSNYDGYIHIIPSLAKDTRYRLKIARDGFPNQKAGLFLWGKNHNLFASSESLDNAYCRHVAFDIEQQSVLYEFNTMGSGDSMALDAATDRLALITNGGDRHTLSIYDVGRQLGRHPINSLELVPAVDKEELEINSSSFSPDGVFLAISRNDDITHVYDSRYMDRELYTFRHTGPRVSVEKSRECGTIGTEWHAGPRGQGLGLITGGVDGCVRFWDMGLAAEDINNGSVLAQVDHDVAYFSLGDIQKGEHRLVVGDFGGGVYIYD